MKRIEVFEEGFFFTFIIDKDTAYLSSSSVTAPYSERKPELMQLPQMNDTDSRFRFVDYEDSGNQTGREVTLHFCSDDDIAVVVFQFYRGERAVSIKVSYSDLNDPAVPETPFRVLSDKQPAVIYSANDDGSEVFRLI